MTARTLAEIISASRLHAYRNGVVATLAAELPDIEVVGHPGKIDIADIVQGDSFHAPSIHVAVAEFRKPTHRVSGLREVPVKVACYIVTEDTDVGERLVMRDELGLAIADAISAIAADDRLSRWGLNDLAPPEDVEFRPLLTARMFDKGTAYYVVTFTQQLTGCGLAFWEPEIMPPPILGPWPGDLPPPPPPPEDSP